MSLRDWLDQFLQFNDREALAGVGKINKNTTDEKRSINTFSLRAAETEGEKDIPSLLQWKTDPQQLASMPRSPQAKSFGGTIGGTNQNPTR